MSPTPGSGSESRSRPVRSDHHVASARRRWSSVKDRDLVELTDLPCFGQSAILAWRKIRSECPRGCGSFTGQAPAIAAPRLKLTDRAARWATIQVGRHGRSVSEVAKDLGCGWHAAMDAVAAYGQALVDDPDRFGDVAALGLDETLRCRLGQWRRQQWTTQIVDVGAGQLLDVVEGRSAAGPIEWLTQQPAQWRDRSSGQRWTYPARIARCSMSCCPTPPKSPASRTNAFGSSCIIMSPDISAISASCSSCMCSSPSVKS